MILYASSFCFSSLLAALACREGDAVRWDGIDSEECAAPNDARFPSVGRTGCGIEPSDRIRHRAILRRGDVDEGANSMERERWVRPIRVPRGPTLGAEQWIRFGQCESAPVHSERARLPSIKVQERTSK